MRKKIIAIGVIALTAVAFSIAFHRNMLYVTTHGSSMYPTIDDGERSLLYKTRDVDRGDIVAVMCDETGGYILKRVIGIEGDEITIDGNGLRLNGSLLYESYVENKGWADGQLPVSMTVPVHSVYVMGDNRAVSADSRKFGVFSLDDILGRIVCRDIPF